MAEEKLKRLGIDTIGALAALPDAEVVSVLGGTIGPSLHRLARGIDDRPVAERADAKQVSAETTYAEDIVTLAGCAVRWTRAPRPRTVAWTGTGALPAPSSSSSVSRT